MSSNSLLDPVEQTGPIQSQDANSSEEISSMSLLLGEKPAQHIECPGYIR